MIKRTSTVPTSLTGHHRIEKLYQKVATRIHTARNNVIRSIDTEMVRAYWLAGRDIVEEEQQGKERAKYGTLLLQELSQRLKKTYGRGFSVTTLKEMRTFYLEYQLVFLFTG